MRPENAAAPRLLDTGLESLLKTPSHTGDTGDIDMTAIGTAKNGGAIASVALRRGTPEDAKDCGRIIYEAFKSIADQHNFAPDLPSVEVATALATALLSHRHFYAVVA